MAILLTAIKVLVAYFALMFISTNLLGIVLRGLITSYATINGKRYIVEDITTTRSKITTIIFLLATFAYFYLLYKYFQIGIPIAAGLFMLTRVPDLLFEMRTGIKPTMNNLPKRRFDVILKIIDWALIPLLWFSFL